MTRLSVPVPAVGTNQISRWLLTGGLALLLLLLIAHSFRWATREDKGLLDYGSFIASGQAANRGEDPYGVYPLTFELAGEPAPNLNPPISVYPLQLLARFDAETSMQVWEFATLVGFGACVLFLWRAYPENSVLTPLAAFAFAGLWHTIELGQIYMPLLVAATIGWLLLRKNDSWWGGVAIGVIGAIKPQFLFWPALLLVARRPRASAGGMIAAGVLYAIPFTLEGPGIYRAWSDATPSLLPANTFAGNSSLLAVAGRFGLDEVGLVLTAVMLLAVGAYVFWRRPGIEVVNALAIVAALLAGPITWGGYTMLLLPVVFAFGLQRTWPGVLLLLVPYRVLIDQAGTGAFGDEWLASVYAWGILAIGTAVLLAARGPRAPRQSLARP